MPMRERVKRRLNEALDRPRSDDADIPKIMYPSPPGHLQYLADEQAGERHQHKQYYRDGRGISQLISYCCHVGHVGDNGIYYPVKHCPLA